MEVLKTLLFNNIEIKVLWEDKKPLFRATEIARFLDLRNIHTSISNFSDKQKVIRSMETIKGLQEVTFLTRNGLISLVNKSRKKIAARFQEWVCDVVESIEDTGKYVLTTQLDDIKLENQLQLEKLREEHDVAQKEKDIELELKNHYNLIEVYDHCNVVYAGRIRYEEDGRFLLKIGSTDNIRERSSSLKQAYGDMTFLKMYKCSDNRKFEVLLHTHEYLNLRRYRNKVHNVPEPKEIYLVTYDEMEHIFKTMSRRVKDYRKASEEKRTLEVMEQKLDTIMSVLNLPNNTRVGGVDEEDIDDEKDNSSSSSDTVCKKRERGFCTTNGTRIQRYSEDGKTLLKTYERMSSVLNDVFVSGCSDTALRNAIKSNTSYKGYRWAFLEDDNLLDTKVQTLEETVVTKKPRLEPVAQLNKDRTLITNVYSDKLTAQNENKLGKKAGVVATLIKNQELKNNHYYAHWSDCSTELKSTWTRDLPPPKKPHQKVVERVDINTGEVLETYYTMDSVIKTFPMANRTLKKAIATKEEYISKDGKPKGFFFQFK